MDGSAYVRLNVLLMYRPNREHEEALRKRPLMVNPLRFAPESACVGQASDLLVRILVTVLRPDGLTAFEFNGKVRGLDVHVRDPRPAADDR